MGNRILSERLCLRQLDAEEAKALLRGEADPGRPWMAGYPMQGTLIAVEAFVRAVDNGANPGAYGVYQLVRSGDDMVVGDIGFHGPPNRGGSVTVGYGLAPGARGQGYATEALRTLVAWALAQPSQRVMERAGMRLYDRSDQLRFYRVP